MDVGGGLTSAMVSLYVVEQGMTRKLNHEIKKYMDFILLELRNEGINAKTILAVKDATGLGNCINCDFN